MNILKYVKKLNTILILVLLTIIVVNPILYAKSDLKDDAHYNKIKSYFHGPITIDGNKGFTIKNGVKSGSGTVDDPYIISNWKISSFLKNGISISNTNAYFVIENCYIDGCKIISQLTGKKTFGIAFSNVTNGKIVDCFCNNFKNSFAIVIISSSNNIVEKCVCKNSQVGLSVNGCPQGYKSHSNNNTIKDCSFSDCKDGIYFCCLPSSMNNVVDSCNLNGNGRGVCLDHCIHYTTITGCNISNNEEVGLEIFSSSDHNHISNNVFLNNKNQAIDNCMNEWDNGPIYGGNYWGKNNVSDPYLIPGAGKNKDFYPLIEEPENNHPIALFTYSSRFPIAGNEIIFDAFLSYDPQRNISRYQWNFGDGTTSEGKKTNHKYNSNGKYTVTLTITAGLEIDTSTQFVNVIQLEDEVINVECGMSIQDAIRNAKPGYTIYVNEGTFHENITVDKPYLSFFGKGNNTTVIDGCGNGDVIYIIAPAVNVSGFTITNSSEEKAGIQIGVPDYSLDCIKCCIKNNLIIGNGIGISMHETEQNDIERNVITNNSKFGIYGIRSFNNCFRYNYLSFDNTGFCIEYGSNWNEIAENYFNDNSAGVSINWSHYNKIIKNNIINNTKGIVLYHAISPKINYNNIHGNAEVGLLYTGDTGNAKNNWWGSKNGPSWFLPLFGDKILGLTDRGALKIISRIKRPMACYPWEKEPVII